MQCFPTEAFFCVLGCMFVNLDASWKLKTLSLCKILMPNFKKLGFRPHKIDIFPGGGPLDPQVFCWTQVTTALGKSLKMTLKFKVLKAKINFHVVLNLVLFSKVRKYENKYWTKICDFTVLFNMQTRSVSFTTNNLLQTEAEELSGFTNQTYNPRPQAEGCMRGVQPDNSECGGL